MTFSFPVIITGHKAMIFTTRRTGLAGGAKNEFSAGHDEFEAIV